MAHLSALGESTAMSVMNSIIGSSVRSSAACGSFRLLAKKRSRSSLAGLSAGLPSSTFSMMILETVSGMGPAGSSSKDC